MQNPQTTGGRPTPDIANAMADLVTKSQQVAQRFLPGRCGDHLGEVLQYFGDGEQVPLVIVYHQDPRPWRATLVHF